MSKARTVLAGHVDLTAWADSAACKGHPTDMWFPTGAAGPSGHDWAAARAVCRICPVRTDCLAHALAHEPDCPGAGMWGGMTPEERVTLRRTRLRHDKRVRRIFAELREVYR